MENKFDKFKRVAEYRTNKILHMLDLLGNCSNKNVYNYTDEQVKKIFSAIETQLVISKNKFKGETAKSEFKL